MRAIRSTAPGRAGVRWRSLKARFGGDADKSTNGGYTANLALEWTNCDDADGRFAKCFCQPWEVAVCNLFLRLGTHGSALRSASVPASRPAQGCDLAISLRCQATGRETYSSAASSKIATLVDV